MQPSHTPIDARTLAAPIVGRQLAGATLGAELGARATALIFLRHFG